MAEHLLVALHTPPGGGAVATVSSSGAGGLLAHAEGEGYVESAGASASTGVLLEGAAAVCIGGASRHQPGAPEAGAPEAGAPEMVAGDVEAAMRARWEAQIRPQVPAHGFRKSTHSQNCRLVVSYY